MFFDVLQERCQANHIKLTPLLDELGLSRGSIMYWRTGAIPNGETLIRLAGRLHCSVDYLLELSDCPDIRRPSDSDTDTNTPIQVRQNITEDQVKEYTLDGQFERLQELWARLSPENRVFALALLEAAVVKLPETHENYSK